MNAPEPKSIDQWEAELGAWNPSAANSCAESVGASDGACDASPSEHRPSATCPTAAYQGSEFMVSVEVSAMACEFEVLLNRGEYAGGVETARSALDVVPQLESELSVYRPQSDFSAVNRWGSERPVAVRFDVFRLISAALDVSRATAGAFDITAGSLSEVWGFSRRSGRRPADDELALAMQSVGSHLLELDASLQTVRLQRPGVKLNPGGIGKGYALDRTAAALVRGGVENFLIHGGRSSICARGRRYARSADDDSGDGWWIALAHPLRWEEKLGRVRLRNCALGTSGAGKQFFHYQGTRYSHIIDPRSGMPAGGMLSATVLCRSGTIADALATALFVMGPDAARQWCSSHPEIRALLVTSPSGSGRMNVERINIPDEDWVEERILERPI
ncbi:MAG: FAD:protein FMN transferase [Pirellulales bacterium]